MQRVIAYVDGFNLYYGLRTKKWRWFYWLNLQSMVRHLLKPHQTLSHLHRSQRSIQQRIP